MLEGNILYIRHEKGLVPKLIRWWTKEWCDHVAILHDGIVFENDMNTNASTFALESAKEGLSYRIGPPVKFDPEELKKAMMLKYSILTSVQHLLYSVKFLRRHIHPLEGKTNCVGFVRRVLQRDESEEFLSPGRLI